MSDSAVIAESLRRHLILDVLDEMWSKATLSEARRRIWRSRRSMRAGAGDEARVRAVVDVNLPISGILSSRGSSAEIQRSSRDVAFALIISELLVSELNRALAYPKLRKRVPAEKATAFVSWVRSHGVLAEDPDDPPPLRSPDPDDDYLLALAISRRAFLVTRDQHLLGLTDDLPILTPAEFLAQFRSNR